MDTNTTKEYLMIAAGSIVGVAFVWWLTEKVSSPPEKFTVHDLKLPGCVSSTKEEGSMNDALMPNSIRLAIGGYNYQETPKFFRNGKEIVPLEYSRDSDNLMYYFTLAVPYGESPCSSNIEWVMETYDFVEPTVVNRDSNKNMKVLPLRRRRGYNRWSLVC